MGKGNGGTRNSGTSTGGILPAPAPQAVDEYAAWRAVEGSEKYTYNPEKVKFEIDKPLSDPDTGKAFDEITEADLKYKGEYDFYEVQRDRKDGKYHMGDGYYQYTEKMTFQQAINRAIRDAKAMYRNNERMADRVFRVNSDNDDAPTAWVWAELVGDNKVKLSISRFIPYSRMK